MNNIPQPQSNQVEQLLVAYHQDHPFCDNSEHTQEKGLHTEQYYSDALAYGKECCEWVQKQMQEQGVAIHIYRLSRGRRVRDSYLYDLTVDDPEVLHNIHYREGDEYALQNMSNEDLYCEAAMLCPQSGRDLRKEHNKIEADLASDGTYPPRYSYGSGLCTSERREEYQE